MKKILFFLAILPLISAMCFAQKSGYVTLADLKTLSKLNQNDFETQVLSRGFGTGLQKEDMSEDCSYYGYNSDIPEPNGGYNQVSLTLCKIAKPIAAFNTSNKNYFVGLKTAFTNAGFHYTGNSQAGEGISNFKNFANGSWRINTYTFEKGGLVFYSIQVWQQN